MRKLIDSKTVRVMTGLGPTELRRRIRAGTFPAPRLRPSSKGVIRPNSKRWWFEDEVIRWMEDPLHFTPRVPAFLEDDIVIDAEFEKVT